MYRRGRATDGVRCIDCSVVRVGEAARQIRAGKGPFYDRYLDGLAAYVLSRLEERQDPDLADEPPYVEY
jgi:hypothetical protein